MASSVAMSPDVPITIKLQVGLENRRFKLPLRDLGANTLPDKLRVLLALPPTKSVVFERYSDSAGTYVTLDSNNPSVYKQLYRAAKAKLKLRIRANVIDLNAPVDETPQQPPASSDRLSSHRYVPPMNPDPVGLNKAPASMNEVAPTNALPSIQATGELQRQAYAQFVRNSMSSYVKGLGNSNVIVTTTPKTVEKKPEAPTPVKAVNESEAPLPRSFTDHTNFYSDLASLSKAPRLPALRAVDQDFHVPAASFTVCCNKCDATIPDTHWHCSICHDGDYDLCRDCVSRGEHCGVEGHFLIKRSIENGKVISSTTETMPKKVTKTEATKEIPGAFTTDVKEEGEEEEDNNVMQHSMELSRTCNSCVNVYEESKFVTCLECEDYDLCIPCHTGLKHGHHPAHTFKRVSDETVLSTESSILCAPGRNMRHAAICDGCDKDIRGVRHKCMNCPDWDYCSTCVKSARQNHPGHRFVPIYEPISSPPTRSQVHYGINCDGPLCKDKSKLHWIVGDRYKCAVCHNTDFCANCEALPTHRHNRTHPVIKFRTPVRNVSVTTLGEKENGDAMCTMGDRVTRTSSKSTETIPAAPSANAATQVQTVAEVKPIEPVKEEPETEKQEIVEEKLEEKKEEVVREETEDVESEKVKASTATHLQARFITDAIPDGSKIRMGSTFQQVWVLRNPGPYSWPAGCSVRFVGGDNMLNVDERHPSSVGEIAQALQSNSINRVVEVNEELAFWVTMKAPERPGKAISYWRLKAADGTAFGHKLWCDIDVVAPETPVPQVEESETEHVEDVAKEAKTEAIVEEAEEPQADEKPSQMIFPKLDKESPVSSTHFDHPAPPSFVSAAEELPEDMENLELDDDDETDEGFLTDEEYEILDASADEEAINGRK